MRLFVRLMIHPELIKWYLHPVLGCQWELILNLYQLPVNGEPSNHSGIKPITNTYRIADWTFRWLRQSVAYGNLKTNFPPVRVNLTKNILLSSKKLSFHGILNWHLECPKAVNLLLQSTTAFWEIFCNYAYRLASETIHSWINYKEMLYHSYDKVMIHQT